MLCKWCEVSPICSQNLKNIIEGGRELENHVLKNVDEKRTGDFIPCKNTSFFLDILLNYAIIVGII